MPSVLITLIFALCVCGVLILLFRWVKTPYYRVDAEKMITILERVLTGQATENDWHLTFGMVIRHSPDLELIRQDCCEIEEKYFIGQGRSEFLFSKDGLLQLEQQLINLKNIH